MISNLCLPESECTLFTQSSIGWVSPRIQPPQKNSLVTNKKIPPKFFHLKYSIQIHWFNGPLKLRYLQCLLCLVFYLSQKIRVSFTYTGWDGTAMVPIKVVEGRLEERFLLILHHPLHLALLLRIHCSSLSLDMICCFLSGLTSGVTSTSRCWNRIGWFFKLLQPSARPKNWNNSDTSEYLSFLPFQKKPPQCLLIYYH